MSTAFETPVAELGESTMRCLRNASARFGGGDLVVEGIFRNRAEVSPIGQAGMYARQPQFQCLAGEVTEVARGEAIEIACQAAPAIFYTIKQRLPDDLHTGWATFLLEPAS